MPYLVLWIAAKRKPKVPLSCICNTTIPSPQQPKPHENRGPIDSSPRCGAYRPEQRSRPERSADTRTTAVPWSDRRSPSPPAAYWSPTRLAAHPSPQIPPMSSDAQRSVASTRTARTLEQSCRSMLSVLSEYVATRRNRVARCSTSWSITSHGRQMMASTFYPGDTTRQSGWITVPSHTHRATFATGRAGDDFGGSPAKFTALRTGRKRSTYMHLRQQVLARHRLLHTADRKVEQLVKALHERRRKRPRDEHFGFHGRHGFVGETDDTTPARGGRARGARANCCLSSSDGGCLAPVRKRKRMWTLDAAFRSNIDRFRERSASTPVVQSAK